MLVCNVSLQPPRAGISAGLAEVASATDATATGNIVFATLVDDPASVRDHVDAYSGEIMFEAASADAAVNAGLTYGAGIVEDTTATAVHDGHVPSAIIASIVEAAAAQASVSAISTTPFTTTGVVAVGPLFVVDVTFSSSSLTIIDVGR